MTSCEVMRRLTSRFAGRTSSELTKSSAPCGSVGSRPRGLPSPGGDECGRVMPKVASGPG